MDVKSDISMATPDIWGGAIGVTLAVKIIGQGNYGSVIDQSDVYKSSQE